jgi:hypothetical protein
MMRHLISGSQHNFPYRCGSPFAHSQFSSIELPLRTSLTREPSQEPLNVALSKVHA